MERHLPLVLFLLTGSLNLAAQKYVYTIKADSVKITNCDSSELIIENHTQNVPGFLFNTGNGRTIFQRGALNLGNGSYLLGADTLNLAANAWLQGGNAFGTTGILGTTDNNHVDFYTNNTPRMRLTNSGRLGIGLTAPAETLDVYGNAEINSLPTSIAKYMIDGLPAFWFGNYGFWDVGVGDSAGFNSSGAYGQVFVGYQAGINNTGGPNICIGMSAGAGNSGGSDLFVGVQAGVDNEGAANSCVGYNSGSYSSGDYNSCLGTFAGYSPTGSYNTYLGAYAGAFTPGSYNVQIGYQSGRYSTGANNVLLGQNSGFFSGGSNNIFIGQYSGANNAGADNVFIGTYTAHSDSAVPYGQWISEITLIGDSSDVTAFNIANATAIGHKAMVHTPNSMVFGDSATTNWYFNTGASPVSGAALVVGSNSSNGNGAYLSNGGTWTNASDRNKKENFRRLDGDAILKKISRLPLTRWNYKGQSEQHIGPVAQDFYRIFQVGENDRTISTIDPSGIALIGVQELYKKWKTAEKRIETLQSTIQSQEERLRRLEEKINQLSK